MDYCLNIGPTVPSPSVSAGSAQRWKSNTVRLGPERTERVFPALRLFTEDVFYPLFPLRCGPFPYTQYSTEVEPVYCVLLDQCF